MTTTIEVTGLKEIIERLEKWPHALTKSTAATMGKAIFELQKAVPPYPPRLPGQKYMRTGMLGASLGSGFGGGPSGGKPDVFTVRQLGTQAGAFEGKFGTKLGYAEYVIDDNKQAGIHRGRWWTMTTIAKKAMAPIDKLFRALAAEMASDLDGKK